MTKPLSFQMLAYDDCWQDLIQIRNECRDTVRDKCYMDWRYLGRPCRKKPKIIWAINELGEKVGSMSIVPHDYCLDGRVCQVGIIGDISVLSTCQGQGIAGKMLTFFIGHAFYKELEGCIVLLSEHVSHLFVKVGWQHVSGINRCVKIINFEPSLRAKLPAFLAIPTGKLINWLARQASVRHRLKLPAEFSTCCTKEFDSSYNQLWQKFDKSECCLGLRTAEYLTWRYHQHPLNIYYSFELRNQSGLCGYIIYYQDNGKVLINDTLCLQGDKYALYLLSEFIRHVMGMDTVESIVLSVNESVQKQYPLNKVGFIKRSDSLIFMIPHQDYLPRDSGLLLGNRWHLTVGDKDV